MKLALVTETFPPEVNGVAMTPGVIARFEADLPAVACRRAPAPGLLPASPGLPLRT